MSAQTGIGLLLAMASATLENIGYVREHEAAAALPCLSLRRPLRSLTLLLTSKRWVRGFVTETGGFVFYVAALVLAPLSLVQSIAAGGVGVLALASARMTGRRLTRRESSGVLLAIAGLAALAASLAGGTGSGRGGSTTALLLWLGATGAIAATIASVGRRALGAAAAYGIAGGLLFSVGDVSTKVTTQGGGRLGFALTLVLGYSLGTALLQLGYQRGGALTVAGLATLLTNAVPIAAGTIVLHEPVPPGLLGGLRALAFVAVTVGAVLLAQPEDPATGRPVRDAVA